MTRLTATIATLFVLGSSAVPALASASGGGGVSGAPIGASYTITLPEYSVSDIASYTYGQPVDLLFAPFVASSPGPTTFTIPYSPFEDAIGWRPTGGSLLIGVAGNEDDQHLVLFTSDTFATENAGGGFSSLFPNTDEATLISDLVDLLPDG